MMYSSVNIEVCAEKCNHLISQSSPAVVSSGTIYGTVQAGFNFYVCGDHSNESYQPVLSLFFPANVFNLNLFSFPFEHRV